MTTATNHYSFNTNGVVVPHEFLCPMTKTIMKDPMMSRHGFSFERSAILGWLAEGHKICPVSGKPLRPSNLVSDNSLLSRIQKWTADEAAHQRGWNVEESKPDDDDADGTSLVDKPTFFGIGKISSPPNEFLCPLTKQVMEDPLMSKDGVSYERDDILYWLESFDFCPVTGKPLTPCNLVKNSNLQTRIIKWQKDENDMSTEEDAYFMSLVPSSSSDERGVQDSSKNSSSKMQHLLPLTHSTPISNQLHRPFTSSMYAHDHHRTVRR